MQLDKQGKLLSVRADRTHPMTLGYACSKGLAAPEMHNHPDRIVHPLKRMPDGQYQPIALDVALSEIAEKLQTIIARDGADAVAAYRGTATYLNALALAMLPLWLRAIGSSSLFSTMTIDQSAKWVTADRLGRWHAGRHPFETAEVALIFGANPLVSIQGGLGINTLNPAKRLAQARERGLQLIVVDPRATELARYADIHLQIYPGEDVTVAAALLHLIFREGWHDAQFCADWADGVNELRRAVDRFTPEYAAQRAGVEATQLIDAARMFAANARLGAASSGTGPNMGPHSNLAEHMIECLNVVCGRYQRVGDRIANPGVLSKPGTLHAEVRPPRRQWEHGPRSRVRGLGRLMGEKLSGALADEILTPGEGQIRALFVVGGNPASALPNPQRAVQALGSLDLLVAIEPFQTTTTQLAHYIFPPKLQYERPDLPVLADPTYYSEPFSQFTPALAVAPEEAVDEWLIFWSLAQRLGRPIRWRGLTLDESNPPTSEALLERLVHDSRIPFTEIQAQPGGQVFNIATEYVQPPRKDSVSRFSVLPPDIEEDLKEVREELPIREQAAQRGFTHLLAVKRLRPVLNSSLQNLSSVRKHTPFNPLSMAPSDMGALGFDDAQHVLITGEHGRIEATVQSDTRQKHGVVSMSHGWGSLPGTDGNYTMHGACTALLVSDSSDVERINAMPRMTALAVRIEARKN